MSIRIDKKLVKQFDINKIKIDCFIQGNDNPYGPPATIKAFAETPNSIYAPFAQYNKLYKNNNIYSKTNYIFKEQEYPFRTDGGRDQQVVYEKALEYLQKHGSVLLSLFCGFGKTFTAIRLAQTLGVKTAVLAHRGVLFDQWINDSINKFTNAKVQRVDTDGILDPDADFYIFNIAYVHKLWNKDTKSWGLKKIGVYKNIGTLIVDEAHICGAEEMSKALLYFQPLYTIALSATPTRSDGMDKVLELYFGNYDTTRIVRISQNPFIIYKYSTNIKPTFKYNSQGKKDWNSVINSLTENIIRNQMIIDIVKKYTESTILILTKRKSHCEYLSKKLDTLMITNTIMVGTSTVYDKNAQVLLSTYSKLGVGFDDSRLNMLIIACDVVDVEQYAGRLRDSPGKERIVFDLVDSDPNCMNHWKKRKEWYLSRNGKILMYPQIEKKEPIVENIKKLTGEPEYKRLAKPSKK